MDPQGKTKVGEEEDRSKTTSYERVNPESGGEEDSLPAKLSLSAPEPFSARFPRRRKTKPTWKKTENALTTKRCVSQTMIKNVTPDCRGKSISSEKNDASADGKCLEPKTSAMIRAEKRLPAMFSKLHLPDEDTTFVLEDESGKQHVTKYIADKGGLSAGWRQFASSYSLVEEDVLVFQLVEPTKFKVYIIRANDNTGVDGALGLLTPDANRVGNPSKHIDVHDATNGKRKQEKSLPLANVQKRNTNFTRQETTPNQRHPAEKSENDAEQVDSEVLEGCKRLVPIIRFEDVKSFENFTIVVDGSVADSEISKDIRNKYYELCCSQKAFLHENLIQGMNLKLIIGTISGTVNIADATRACNLTISRDELASWDTTLKAFGLLGMNVGFLRARLHKIISLAYDSEKANKTRRYIQAKSKRARTEEEITSLEERLMELRRNSERFTDEIDSLRSKAENYEVKFREEVSAPW